MGTRSLTYVYDGDDADAVACMYKQYDGYPEGYGKELVTFLEPFRVVNGFGGDDRKSAVANGAGCLAAQLIANFKEEVGGVYLMAPNEKLDAGQDYVYKVRASEGRLDIEVYDAPYKKPLELMFKGTPAEVQAWIANRGENEE